MMDDIIKIVGSTPFSSSDILTVCDNETKVITYPELYRYKTISEVLKPYNNAVILYETRPSYGHWCCLIRHPKNTIEFFDPYGLFIDEQLEFINHKFRKQNREDYPILTKMLYDSKANIVYNNIQLQRYINDVSTCGRHVALRIINREIPLDEYIRKITSKKLNPDEVVTYLTAFQK